MNTPLTNTDMSMNRVDTLEDLVLRFLEQFNTVGGKSEFIGSDSSQPVVVSLDCEDLIYEAESALYDMDTDEVEL